MVQRSGKYSESGGRVAGRFSAICVALAICALITGCTISFRYHGDAWDTLPPPDTSRPDTLPPPPETTSEAPIQPATTPGTTAPSTGSSVIITTAPPPVTSETAAPPPATGTTAPDSSTAGTVDDDPEKLTTHPLETTETAPPQTTAATPKVEAGEAVDAAYFSDALFLGDSRTVGLSLYSGLRSNYYSQQGLNISTVASSAFIAAGEDKLTLSQALEQNSHFTKVYISFGINEIGWPKTDSFIASYATLIDLVSEKLPDAVIYVQEILPMSKATAESKRYADMGGNGKVAEYNGRLLALCEEKGIHYIALTEIFADENGDLNVTDSFDGIHLGVKSSKAWIEYLKTHTAP